MRIKKEIKKVTVALFFILGSLFIYNLFPTKGLFQQIFTSVTFFVITPVFFIKLIAKENFAKYGITKGNSREGLLWGGISLISALIVFFIWLKFFHLASFYSVSNVVKENFTYFLLYELLIVPFFVVLYDFFFRAFIMFSFFEKIGWWVILLQFSLFLLLLLYQGSQKEFILFLIFAPFSGLIVLKSKSLYYSFLAQILFIIVADTSIIAFIR